ncbi:rRNA maturation RNase YbeY [Patescibacteria group bacterium]|nr:rRNA maturation RNase YbeY [Patescibacteria group bacterium]
MECNIYFLIKDVGISKVKIKKIISAVLINLKKNQNLGLSVNLVGDKKIKSLNKIYRKKNIITDVLSFSLLAKDSLISEKSELGDIFICIPQIKRQARELKIDFEEEFTRMLVHGVLHLLGFDHQKQKDAVKMFNLQEKIVQNFL